MIPPRAPACPSDLVSNLVRILQGRVEVLVDSAGGEHRVDLVLPALHVDLVLVVRRRLEVADAASGSDAHLRVAESVDHLGGGFAKR